jgi:hypothetical protein
MALKQPLDLPGGVTVADAYIRVEHVTLNPKQTVVATVRAYKDAAAASERNALAWTQAYSFAWPVDAAGAPVLVENAQAFAYIELKKLEAFATALDA